ncbi:MAG: NAD(P)H-dependent glycerol-3-phosphate dehydrogenase [Pseudomonadota bacterium]
MIGIVGAGAFGTALGIALARDGVPVCLYGRNVGEIARTRENTRYLPGIPLPAPLHVTGNAADLGDASVILLAAPMQILRDALAPLIETLNRKPLVACCKGIELDSGLGPTALIKQACPASVPAILTGPSFAADLADGLPTALTLGCADRTVAKTLQDQLSCQTMRLYSTTDVTGAELGGALKNVIALAAGLTIGAGLGESARAAVVTRGFAEMGRFASLRGARLETLAGLSGLGDLLLTATSEKSRNYAAGLAIGRGESPPKATTEGVATAQAMARIAKRDGLDMPLTQMVSSVVLGQMSVDDAKRALLARPLKEE